MAKETLTYQNVIDSITNTMNEMEGEIIAEIYNIVCSCSRKIRYVEDSIWEYIEEDE